MNKLSLGAIALISVTSGVAIAPQVQAVGLTGLTRDNTLVNFDSASPNAASFVQVTGVVGNLLGIDYRPADGQLYGWQVATIFIQSTPAQEPQLLQVPLMFLHR